MKHSAHLLLGGLLAACIAQAGVNAASAQDSPFLIADSLLTDAPHALGVVEIRASGSVRFSEQLRMIPGLAAWSQDRYTLRLLGTGQEGLLSSGPTFLLDGLAIPVAFLDRPLTETLPVTPSAVTTLRFDAGQRSHEGARLRDGVMHVRTPMLQGWEAGGALAVINETGDPGPAKHRDGRLQNVDRSGPATALHMGWGNGRWTVQTGLQSDLHHLTDQRIAGRVRLTYAENAQPVITQFSPWARLRARTLNWRLDLAGGRAWRKDFVYLESAGWEWPSRWTRDWVASRALWKRDGLQAGVEADGWTMSSTNRPSFIDLPAPVRLMEAQSRGTVGWIGSHWRLTTAGGVRLIQAAQLEVDVRHMLPLAELALSWNSGISLSGIGLDDAFPQERSWSAAASLSLARTGRQGRWKVSLDGESGHFPEAGNLSFWAASGVDTGSWMTLASLPTPLPVPRRLQGQWLVERAIGAWTGWFALEGRWADGLLLEDRRIDQPFGIGPLLPSWSWSAPHGGWLFSRTVGVRRVEPDRIQWRGQFQFQHVSSQGDDTYFRAATGFPRNRVWISAAEQRPGGIRWFVRAAWQGAWTWPQYLEPAERELPASLWLDATVGKTLLSGHMEALVSLLNLPDRPLMTHPAGVEEQLAIRLTVLFQSRPGPSR